MTFKSAQNIAAIVTGLALSAAFALGLQLRAGPPATKSVHRGVDLSRLVIWTEAAGGYATARGFDPLLLNDGWKAFVTERIKPETDWLKSKGVIRPRVLIHNPYGLDRDASGNVDAGQNGQYRFSQRSRCAANLRTRHLATGLGPAIKPLVDSGVEVIVYFGAMTGGDASEKLAASPGRGDDFIRHCEYQVKEALDAGCSIAFDASNDFGVDSPQWGFVNLIKSLTRTYLEPRAGVNQTHLHGLPFISQDAFWTRSDPAKFPDSQWGATNKQLTGEVIRFIQFPDDDATGTGWGGSVANVAARMIAPAIRIQADGHTVAMTTGLIRRVDQEAQR